MIREHIASIAIVGLLFMVAFGLLPVAESFKGSPEWDDYKYRPRSGVKAIHGSLQPNNPLLEPERQEEEPSTPVEPIYTEGNYIKKSSLVPCTCPGQSMSCAHHAGSQSHQKVPGEMDDAPWKGDDWRKERYKKPFAIAFSGGDDSEGMRKAGSDVGSKNEPSGYMGSFTPFMK